MSEKLNDHYKQYLRYVASTGGNASIAAFDDDWEPIGPLLRRDLMPRYIEERGGKLFLTEAGKAELEP